MQSSRRPPYKAFTLIELLVSMAVLTLIVAMITQLVNSASKVISQSRDTMDGDAQARLVLDRLDADLARMLKRPDVNYIFAKQSSASDNLFFYSEAPAFYQGPVTAGATTSSPESSLSLLGYRINNRYQLERLGRELSWDGVSPGTKSPQTGVDPGAIVFLSYNYTAPPAGTPVPTPTPVPLAYTTLQGNWPSIGTSGGQYKDGTDPCYHVLAEQVFRMEICFLVKKTDGTVAFSNYPVYPATKYSADGSVNGFPSELTAIVTTIALLDVNSRYLIGGNNKLANIAQLLPDPQDADLAAGKLPAENWSAILNAPTFAVTAQIPNSVASKIRVYQRTTYLPPK